MPVGGANLGAQDPERVADVLRGLAGPVQAEGDGSELEAEVLEGLLRGLGAAEPAANRVAGAARPRGLDHVEAEAREALQAQEGEGIAADGGERAAQGQERRQLVQQAELREGRPLVGHHLV